jgi:hypothetical protein
MPRENFRMGSVFLLSGVSVLGAGTGSHAQILTTLKPESAAAFEAVVMDTELAFERPAQGDRGFLWADEGPSRRQLLTVVLNTEHEATLQATRLDVIR